MVVVVDKIAGKTVIVHRVVVKPKRRTVTTRWASVTVCRHCRASWQLDKSAGTCPKCGQDSQAYTYQVRILPKARHRPKPSMTRDEIEQGYDGLEGEWLEWLEVARTYEGKVPRQDRLDIRHDIILELHRARERDKKPLPPLRAYKIASLMVALYWRRLKRQPTLLSLDEPVSDYEGNEVRLLDTIADDKALDLAEWLDAKTWLAGCPMRLVEIATKKLDRKPLSKADQKYLERYRAKTQLSLL